MSYLVFYFDQMSYSTICRIDELSYSTNCRVDEWFSTKCHGSVYSMEDKPVMLYVVTIDK